MNYVLENILQYNIKLYFLQLYLLSKTIYKFRLTQFSGGLSNRIVSRIGRILGRTDHIILCFRALVSIYGTYMVSQNMWRTHDGKEVFSKNISDL